MKFEIWKIAVYKIGGNGEAIKRGKFASRAEALAAISYTEFPPSEYICCIWI